MSNVRVIPAESEPPAWYSSDYHLGMQRGIEEAAKRVERMLWVYGMSQELVVRTIKGKAI